MYLNLIEGLQYPWVWISSGSGSPWPHDIFQSILGYPGMFWTSWALRFLYFIISLNLVQGQGMDSPCIWMYLNLIQDLSFASIRVFVWFRVSLDSSGFLDLRFLHIHEFGTMSGSGSSLHPIVSKSIPGVDPWIWFSSGSGSHLLLVVSQSSSEPPWILLGSWVCFLGSRLLRFLRILEFGTKSWSESSLHLSVSGSSPGPAIPLYLNQFKIWIILAPGWVLIWVRVSYVSLNP